MSDKPLLLALDAGTGSFRAVVFDEKGQEIALSQIEWIHPTNENYPGSIEFDINTNWEIIKKCLRKLFHENDINPAKICGISTTSMREGFILYDQNGNELMGFSNVDARSIDETIYLKENYPELEEELYQKTSQTFALSAIPRLLWVKNNLPEVYQQISYFNMINDWIVYKLTGKIVSEPSNSSTSGLFDLENRKWLPEILEKFDMKTDIFPKVYESGSFVAHVSRESAIETGLSQQSMVITGGGDAQLGSLGIGNVLPNQAGLFGGSFWQYEFNTPKVITDPEADIRVNCHAIPNMWQIEAIAWNSGLVMRWFRDAFCQEEKALAKKQNTTVYSLLDKEAAKIPAGSYGLISTFADTMKFKNLKHAAPTFTNFSIDPEKFNKYTFYRSIMENAGLISYSHFLAVSKLTGFTPTEIVFAGGSSYSPLWCQIICDIFGIKLSTPKEKEATALGAAMLAGIGSGVFNSLDQAKKIVKKDKIFYPDTKNHQEYLLMFEKWQEVYKSQLDLSDRKITNYMWIAPGAK